MKVIVLILITVINFGILTAKEVSAVWVLPWSLSSAENIDTVLENLYENGQNAIMAEVRYRADALYIPNKQDSTYVNLETRSHVLKGSDFDALQYLLDNAPKYGIDVHAWMTVLVSTPRNLEILPENHFYYKNADWVTTNKDSVQMDRFSSEGLFIDAGIPEVQEYLLDVIGDVVVNYPALAGIHLDYIRYPGEEYGYHPQAIEQFLKSGVQDTFGNRMKWKEGVITELVQKINLRIKSINPTMELSAAVIADRVKARTRYSQDWLKWLEKGYIDKVYLMAYTKKSETLDKMLKDEYVALHKKDIIVGLRAWNESKTEYKGSEIVEKVNITRENSYGGVALFSYSGILQQGYWSDLKRLFPKK